MAFTSHPVLFAIGAALVVVGYLLWRVANRWDLKGHAIESGLRSVWHRRVVVSDELSERYRDVRDAPTHMRRAGKVAGHAARHFAAQAMSIGAMISVSLGIGLAVVAVIWK